MNLQYIIFLMVGFSCAISSAALLLLAVTVFDFSQRKDKKEIDVKEIDANEKTSS